MRVKYTLQNLRMIRFDGLLSFSIYHGDFSIVQVVYSEVGEVKINGADAFYSPFNTTQATCIPPFFHEQE